MTKTEFNRWWSDLATRFPSIAGWLTRLEPLDSNIPQDRHQKNILGTWYDVLKDVPLDDAIEVSVMMQRGELEQIGAFDSDREKTPNVVRRHARQLAFEREERIMHRQGESYERVHDSFPAGKLLRRIIELQDRGVPDDEAKATALREFESLMSVS